MKVKDIVELLPKEHPFIFEIYGFWGGLVFKDDCAYNRILQEYGDYNVIGIEASDSGIYDYAIIWLKIEKQKGEE